MSLSTEVQALITASQNKPARIKPSRDRNYLSGQAQRLFSRKRPAQIFINPTDDQLDKIFSGELWGYE